MTADPIVIDFGSLTTKAGFAGFEKPSVIFPSLISSNDDGSVYIGSEAKQNLPNYKPYSNGSFSTYENLDKFCHHIFTELNTSAKQHAILIADSLLNESHRPKLAEFLFERLHVPAVSFCFQPVLGLASAGKINGTVIDLGEDLIQVACVTPSGEFTLNKRGKQSCQVNAGKELSTYMSKLIQENHSKTVSDDIARSIKEQCCFTALDYEFEIQSAAEIEPFSYTLPDSSVINLTIERFQCVEALFKPELMNSEAIFGLHEHVYNCIQCVPDEFRKSLYDNMVLQGGSSLIKNLQERFKFEMKNLVPVGEAIKIKAAEDRINGAWIGGSTVASMGSFSSKCVTFSEYEDHGDKIIEEKFSSFSFKD